MDGKSDILIGIGTDVTESRLHKETIADEDDPSFPFAQNLPLWWDVVGECVSININIM